MLIERERIISELKKYIGVPVIKVISGIRRCGKSKMLQLLKEELLKRGAPPENIIFINFESMEFESILNAADLNDYIVQKTPKTGQFYILLDEIQMVDKWERVVSSLLADGRWDIFITGSNSKLLSGDLATLLGGRFVRFEMYPLSFLEYGYFKEKHGYPPKPEKDELEDYIKNGGFPIVTSCLDSPEIVKTLISEIYQSVVLQDVIKYGAIRNPAALERIIHFLFDNVGSLVNAKKISDYFKSERVSINVETVDNYIKALETAYIFYRVPRFDVCGKELLKINEKFYLADHSFMFIRNGFQSKYVGDILENLVFLELKRRGYSVYVGKNGDLEIDFVAQKDGDTIYIQVCLRMELESTKTRELASLENTSDNFPKFIITTEPLAQGNINGIKILQLSDFLSGSGGF